MGTGGSIQKVAPSSGITNLTPGSALSVEVVPNNAKLGPIQNIGGRSPIAVSGKGNILLAIASNIAGDITVDLGEFLGKKLAEQLGNNAEKEEPEFDIFFATLRVRFNPFLAKGEFAQGCPTPGGDTVVYASRSVIKDQKETIEVTSTFIIGFWGVHVLITNYDEAKLSAWPHGLDRRNYGSIALCRDAAVLHEQPIHYSEQFVLVPFVKQLVDSVSGRDSYGQIPNSVFGYLIPGVEAKISFLPVYQAGSNVGFRDYKSGATCAEKIVELRKEFFKAQGVDPDEPPDYFCVRNAPVWKCDEPSSKREKPRIVEYHDVGNMCE